MSKDDVRDSVRDEFSKLSLDGKTAFLVEAIFSTAGSAINEIGSRLNNLVSLVTEPFEAKGDDSSETEETVVESEESAASTSKKSTSSSASSKSSSSKRRGSSSK